jgi:oxygen-independent coproporphyrinogen-3 oxidase
VFTEEILTPTQQLNEYIMVTLRTIEGISLKHIRESFGEAVAEALLKRAVPIATRQLLQIQNDTLQLTDAGKFLADGITADLFAD